MALKTRHSDVYRDSWKPLLESSEGKKPRPVVRRKEKWIHEDKELLFGSIVYKGKHLGTTESKNTTELKQFVKKSVYDLYYKKPGKVEVEIAVSVRSIIVTDTKTKMHICKQKLQKIVFCSEDKSINDKILAFVVKKAENQLLCFCFETHSPASRITLSVGQAFQLAFERSQEAKDASHIFAREMKKLKAMKGKQDYAKRLEEVMTNPDKIDDDVLTDMDFSKGAKRLSKANKGVSDLFQSWQQLTDTLRPLRDADEQLPSFDVTTFDQDIDTALAQIDRDLREWSNAKNPYHADQVAVTDALKELDNLLGSDSQSLISGIDSRETLHEESTQL